MRRAIAIGAILSMSLVYPAAAQAQPRAERPTTNVTGTWIGSNYGFESGVFINRQVRYTVTTMNGQTLTGTKSWRLDNGDWSETEVFQGVLRKTGEFLASDEDGIFIGELTSRNRITGTYLEVGTDAAVLVTTLTKQKSTN